MTEQQQLLLIPEVATKRCKQCGTVKPIEEFHRRARYGDCRNPVCKACLWPRTRQKALDKYGITIAEYDAMLAAQGGVCSICGNEKPYTMGGVSFNIDHDHRCCPPLSGCENCIRGLVCRNCNLTLGFFERSREQFMAHLDARPLRDLRLAAQAK